MTIDQLQYFLAISQCRSFTMAANHLYISQPALSKSIAALERELQVQLLVRNTKTVALTPAGEEFARTCQEMMETFRDGLNKMMFMSGTVSGRVTVGISNQYVDNFVIGLIRSLQQAYPLIQLELHFFPPNGLLRAIDNHSIDIIFSSDVPRGNQLSSKLLKQYRNCMLLPDNHPLADRTELSFAELKNEGAIIIDNMISGEEADAMIETARREGCSPHVIGVARSLAELITRVACGQGIAVVSEKYMDFVGEKLVLIPLKQQSISKLHMIWRSGSNPCIDAIAAFTGAMVEQDADRDLFDEL